MVAQVRRTPPSPLAQSLRLTLPKPSEADMAMTRTADALLKNLTVAAKGRSRAVGVTFESTDPRLAAAVANAVVDSYVSDQLDAKLFASAQANEWLSQRVAEIRDQVINTDRQLQQRKVDAGITDGRQVGLIQEQISGLSEQMIAVHSQGDSGAGSAATGATNPKDRRAQRNSQLPGDPEIARGPGRPAKPLYRRS